MKKTLMISAIIVLATGCAGKQDPAASNTNPLDLNLGTQITSEALANSNIKLCATIKDEAQQKDCQMRVNDQEFTKKALSSNKKSDCSKVEDKDSQTRCELLIEDALEKENEQANLDELQAEISKIVSAGQVSKCSKVEDSNLRTQCETQIYLNKALSTKDPSDCKEIKIKEISDVCLQQISSK